MQVDEVEYIVWCMWYWSYWGLVVDFVNSYDVDVEFLFIEVEGDDFQISFGLFDDVGYFRIFFIDWLKERFGCWCVGWKIEWWIWLVLVNC